MTEYNASLARPPMAAAQPAPNAAQSTFVGIPGPARAAIVVYYLLYHLCFPMLAVLRDPDAPAHLVAGYSLAQVLLTALALYPLVAYRTHYGWLHPLILPFLVTTAKLLFKQPLHLIVPLDVPVRSLDIETASRAFMLRTLPIDELGVYRIGFTLMMCLVLAVYYLAFFTARPKPTRWRFTAPPLARVWTVTIVIVALANVAVAGFIVARGGIEKQLLALIAPRFTTMGGLGHFQEFANLAGVALIFLAATDRAAFRKVLFWLMVLATGVSTILISGSRGSVVNLLLSLGIVWMLHHRMVPWSRVAVGALVAFLVFGAFGTLRQQHGKDTVDFSVVTSGDIRGWIAHGADEATERYEEESSFAAFVGAHERGFAYGATYVGAVFFWIPRAIWEDKPRTAGAWNNAQNFGGREVEFGENVQVGGRPVGGEVESYWNFFLFGPVLLGLFMGWLHKWLAVAMETSRGNPYIWTAFVILIVSFSGSSISMIHAARFLGSLVIIGLLLQPRLMSLPEALGLNRAQSR